MMKKKKIEGLKVLVIGAEMWPYASVGGLSRFIYNLPKALINQGVDCRVFMPKYGKIDTQAFELEIQKLQIKMPDKDFGKEVTCNVLVHQLDGITTYFLENQEYYELRANEYGYIDDPIRWGLLQRGVWEFLKVSDWIPDIIHCNDWQTGLVSEYFVDEYKQLKELKNIKTVFTMHNLRFQAGYDHNFVTEVDFDSGRTKIPAITSKEFEKLNSVRRGIMYSDALTTVSPTYAKEILTPDFGESQERLLNELRYKLHGILNGIDYSDFDTAEDDSLASNFKVGEWNNRSQNKAALQERFMLDKNPNAPLFVISYRLTDQKGLSLVTAVIETILNEFDAQLIVNGDGETGFKSFFRYLSEKYPNQVGVNLSYDEQLPRMLFAGGDFLLHPSKFEPCGIVQLEAMRYGCIPIVREVGGLADTVIEGETGFTFKNFNEQSLLITISRAVEIYKHEELVNSLRKACMEQDFSWDNSAKKYIKIYNEISGAQAEITTMSSDQQFT